MKQENSITFSNDPVKLLDTGSLYDLLTWPQNQKREDDLRDVKIMMNDAYEMMARGMHDDILTEEPEKYRHVMEFMTRLKHVVEGLEVVNESV